MTYSTDLADRIRLLLPEDASVSEREMFGGIGFMIQGNMACGVIGNDLMVRVGPEQHEHALGLPSAKPFDMTGRPMRGWVLVGAVGLQDDDQFREWVDRGVRYASSLPAK